ncbi:hypothetical protein AAG570_009959 [Ranatra chinensis]|uniref:Uncharacterized protein n=1 Tax=Ranatra chinensis TaxID=642074 RepID=A0ABD0YQL4_9HEMI
MVLRMVRRVCRELRRREDPPRCRLPEAPEDRSPVRGARRLLGEHRRRRRPDSPRALLLVRWRSSGCEILGRPRTKAQPPGHQSTGRKRKTESSQEVRPEDNSADSSR